MKSKLGEKLILEVVLLIFAVAAMTSSAYADLQIDSNFDSGSIGSYTIDNDNNEIDFAFRTDSLINNPYSYTYWTNFRVIGVLGKKIEFHITNAGKVSFLKATTRESQMVYSCDGENWLRLTNHSYSDGVYTFSETFNCDEVQIATFFPFSYEKMSDYVEAISTNQWVTTEILGYSEQGRDISLLTITDSATPVECKKVIYIIGRQHAAEVPSSYMLEGMINFLISDDAYASNFRRDYIWYIIPMVNPDGVYLGNSRATSESRDANRDWGNTKTVEVNTARSHIESINVAYGIDFFIDWHSHIGSSIWQNYIYAPSGNTFINILSHWTNFDSKKGGPTRSSKNCGAQSCVSTAYIMDYTLCDNTFTFEPLAPLVSWTQDSLNAEGVDVAFAIDDYLRMLNTKNFGNSHVFSNTTTTDKRRAMPYTMPEDGTITSITMYHEAGNGRMLLGVYADDGQGNPGSQLAVTAETPVSNIEGWQSIELIEPVFVPAKARIWLAWVYENNPGIYYQTGSPGRAESNDIWNGGMPAAFGPSSIDNYIYSICATYIPELATFKDIGNTEVLSFITTRDERRAVPYTMPEDGTITSITMYHEAGNGKMLLGVYADDGQGNPGSQLGVSAETDVSSFGGWQTVDLIASVFVPAGTKIWLAWVYEKNPGIRYQSGTPGRAESNESWNDEMPTAFGPCSIKNYIYSIYATYIPGFVAFEDVGNTAVFPYVENSFKRHAMPYTMPEDGFIESISMYHNGGSGKMLLGVYADDGQGNPGSQLAVTEITDVSNIEGWQTVDLIASVFVPAGTKIWLAWVYENNPGIRYQLGSPGRAGSSEFWNDGMPAAYGPSSIENYIYSIYASYFPAGATSQFS